MYQFSSVCYIPYQSLVSPAHCAYEFMVTFNLQPSTRAATEPAWILVQDVSLLAAVEVCGDCSLVIIGEGGCGVSRTVESLKSSASVDASVKHSFSN
ncbi:hypothetical protein CBL_11092 [Carabus blaptoides fortunei]